MLSLLLVIIYFAFISLGLPDGLLGSAWPTMRVELSAPVSMMGIISFIIAAGTVISSLQSDRLTFRFGVGKITTVSVAMTAAAIFGFSVSHSFWELCFWAVPYGLGAGSIDAALNNYVALHYKSRHMSWLHCMWGIGASAGPLIMGFVLTHGFRWNRGYACVGIIQVVLTVILLFSLPLWQKKGKETGSGVSDRKPMSLKEILGVPGVWSVMITFFCYCAIEQTTGQWAASFLVLTRGISAADAAHFASMFFIGITLGRGICGFITFKLNDSQMIHMGFAFIVLGIILIFLPFKWSAIAGLIIVGFGCAPIYPSLIHATPAHFGADKSQAVIGVQMASAYVGTTLVPPIFGLIAEHISAWALPVYLLIFLGLMTYMNSRLEHESLAGANKTA